MTVRIHFIPADGTPQKTVDAPEGEMLLALAQNAGMPLEGTCEGQMACSTCHVIIAAEDFGRLPRASEEEEDMLDMAASVARTSRLACQIRLTADLDGLHVRIPSESRNLQGL